MGQCLSSPRPLVEAVYDDANFGPAPQDLTSPTAELHLPGWAVPVDGKLDLDFSRLAAEQEYVLPTITNFFD